MKTVQLVLYVIVQVLYLLTAMSSNDEFWFRNRERVVLGTCCILPILYFTMAHILSRNSISLAKAFAVSVGIAIVPLLMAFLVYGMSSGAILAKDYMALVIFAGLFVAATLCAVVSGALAVIACKWGVSLFQ